MQRHRHRPVPSADVPPYLTALRNARDEYDAQLLERIRVKREMERDYRESRDPVCKHYLRGAIETVTSGIRRIKHELASVERTLQLARVS